jgi:predicted RNA-binding protein with PIN domain
MRRTIEQVRDELHHTIQKVQTGISDETQLIIGYGATWNTYARLDEGLSKKIEEAMRMVARCAKTELLKGI